MKKLTRVEDKYGFEKGSDIQSCSISTIFEGILDSHVDMTSCPLKEVTHYST